MTSPATSASISTPCELLARPVTEDAVADVEDLRRTDERLLVEALRIAKRVDERTLAGKQLRYFSKTGDLTDCFRVYFGAAHGEDTHRMVFRELDDGAEVVEVVVLAERDADIPYLLAALRLGRLDDPLRQADARRRIAKARRKRD